jgi:hypothetical protein
VARVEPEGPTSGAGTEANEAAIEAAENEEAAAAALIDHLVTELDGTYDEQIETIDFGELCTVNLILTTPEEITLYRDAGDPVVTNDPETLGAKRGREWREFAVQLSPQLRARANR